MDGWNYEPLWQKSKLYIDRALAENRDNNLFPFWAALALEFLARATLARIHPALLAEPDCILHAFGYNAGKPPKSIMAKTLFARCQTVVPHFGQEEVNACMSVIDRRNEELHTGNLSFDSFPTAIWLPEYYRVCSLLLSFQGKNLTDFLGEDEAEAAGKMIRSAEEQVIGKVQKAIDQKKAEFEGLDADEQSNRRQLAELAATNPTDHSARVVQCPACEAKAVITGERVSAAEPRIHEGLMHQDVAFLPVSFLCPSCGLTLSGHAFLHAAKMGGQYSVTETWDPVEYYGEKWLEYLAEDNAYMNE